MAAFSRFLSAVRSERGSKPTIFDVSIHLRDTLIYKMVQFPTAFSDGKIGRCLQVLNVTWPRSLDRLVASGVSGSLFPILNRDCVSRGDRGRGRRRSLVCMYLCATDRPGIRLPPHSHRVLLLLKRSDIDLPIPISSLTCGKVIHPASAEESTLARSLPRHSSPCASPRCIK